MGRPAIGFEASARHDSLIQHTAAVLGITSMRAEGRRGGLRHNRSTRLSQAADFRRNIETGRCEPSGHLERAVLAAFQRDLSGKHNISERQLAHWQQT